MAAVAKTGISQPVLSRLENGRARTSSAKLHALAKAYRCRPADLLLLPAMPSARTTAAEAETARGIAS